MVTIAEVDILNEIKLCQRKMNYIECFLDDYKKKNDNAETLFRNIEDTLNDLFTYVSETVETEDRKSLSNAIKSSFLDIMDIVHSKLESEQDDNQNNN